MNLVVRLKTLLVRNAGNQNQINRPLHEHLYQLRILHPLRFPLIGEPWLFDGELELEANGQNLRMNEVGRISMPASGEKTTVHKDASRK